MESVLLAEIALVNQLAHALLAQIIVALVDGDLVNPREQRAAEIEALNREVDLGEDLLRDILGIVVIPQDSVDDGEDLGLVTLDDLAKGQFVLGLHASYERRLFGIAV